MEEKILISFIQKKYIGPLTLYGILYDVSPTTNYEIREYQYYQKFKESIIKTGILK